ncbi:MAG: protein-export chaperone SecB [Pyrinomonadaceae bacterium]|nr:protein-export chaperone SecB [Pyrinomonadaceae bacterium]
MQFSSLQLEGYFLKEVSFSLNEEITEKPTELKKSENLGVEVSTSVECIDKRKRRWRCELTLDLKPKDKATEAYTFHLILVGFFFISKDYPKDMVELLAKTNCPAVLYSTAREMLVTVVRRSPFAPVLIPSVTFLEVDTEHQKSESSKITKGKAIRTKKSSK